MRRLIAVFLVLLFAATAHATVTIKLRRDTAANWTSADPTLSLGEVGVDTTNDLIKIGDGTTAWSSLPYATLVAANGITEAMLKAVDTASDEECLTYESTTGDFEWQTCGAGGGATALDDLSDVVITTPSGSHILIYDGVDSFDNKAVSGDVTIASTGAVTIGSDKILESMLKAVDTASDEECLTYESTTGDFEWQSCAAASLANLDDLNDVTIATPASGHILIYDGTDSFDNKAVSGDITITNNGVTAIGDDKVTEADLKAVDTPNDEEFLTYETTTGDFEWQTVAADNLSDVTVSTPADGQLFVYDTNAFVNKAASGDLTLAASGAFSIGNDKITEAMLKAVDSATDEECLTYESTTGDFEWQSCGTGGSSNSFETINASSGTDPVADSATDTLNVTGGTAISVTGDSTTDTITIAVSDAELAALAGVTAAADRVPYFTSSSAADVWAVTSAGRSMVTNGSTQQKCFVIKGATDSDDYPVEKFPMAITITGIRVYAIGGTNVVGGLDECTGTNGVCSSVTAVDSDITGTAGSQVSDDGSLTNGGIAANNWIQWHTTSVSGTNTSLSVCFNYTVD